MMSDSASNASPINVSVSGAVGIIELARPEKFNCLSLAVYTALDAALAGFEKAGSGVRAILIRAQGKHFCTGADLDEVKALRQDADRLAYFINFGHDVLRRFEASPLPVVAACQGLTLAGGIELMLSCDVVFAAKDARFGDQHAQFGLVPGWGGSQRLPRIAGLRRSLDLLFSARWLEAEVAQQWGLVNYLCDADKLHAEALEYCNTLAQRSRVGLATMKRLAREGMEKPLADALTMEAGIACAALRDDDVSEGLAAFEARRKPVFKA
jgi:enoyl-CoA hydratase